MQLYTNVNIILQAQHKENEAVTENQNHLNSF